jgi:hypothetical protein
LTAAALSFSNYSIKAFLSASLFALSALFCSCSAAFFNASAAACLAAASAANNAALSNSDLRIASTLARSFLAFVSASALSLSVFNCVAYLSYSFLIASYSAFAF